ncbi:MAG: orotidine-5'-phosphate decarboxylase [Verrucomicrobiae bacterium]|nr:orotidine-5'-phosphate decarboxylase [Verrucomicrobiae bacterium]
MAKSKLILALDVPSEAEARRHIDRLRDSVGVFKVGLQLFTACGPQIVEYIRRTGAEVFLDLKFHDIPNTVAHAVKSAAALDVAMLTLHAGGGSDMLKAAREAAESAARKPLLLAVTVLTSMDKDDLMEVGVDHTPSGQVLNLARLAFKQSGIPGLVSSPLEVPFIREQIGPDVKIVTPGIRPSGAGADDQKRTMTPGEAIRAGANYLVVGRPILEAENPAQAAADVVREIEQAIG